MARKMKMETAKADLSAHADWRAANVPEGRISEAEVHMKPCKLSKGPGHGK